MRCWGWRQGEEGVRRVVVVGGGKWGLIVRSNRGIYSPFSKYILTYLRNRPHSMILSCRMTSTPKATPNGSTSPSLIYLKTSK